MIPAMGCAIVALAELFSQLASDSSSSPIWGSLLALPVTLIGVGLVGAALCLYKVCPRCYATVSQDRIILHYTGV